MDIETLRPIEKTSEKIKVSVFDYTDYRKFLSDFYEEKKRNLPNFSYRAFALKAELGSPSHFQMIVKGQRNLSFKTIPKFAQALGLREKEKRYFETLVLYNQTEENALKVQYYNDLLKFKDGVRLKTLERAKYNFLSKWYMVAIYVLVDIPSFNPDPQWISKKLGAKITTRQVSEALETLERLELIKRDPTRGYKQVMGALNTDDDTRSMAVYNYHTQMISLALQALRKSKLEDREMNGVTIAISKDKLPLLKEKIRKFRADLNELTSSFKKPEDVYQMNIQLFPLTEEKIK